VNDSSCFENFINAIYFGVGKSGRSKLRYPEFVACLGVRIWVGLGGKGCSEWESVFSVRGLRGRVRMLCEILSLLVIFLSPRVDIFVCDIIEGRRMSSSTPMQLLFSTGPSTHSTLLTYFSYSVMPYIRAHGLAKTTISNQTQRRQLSISAWRTMAK